MCCLHLILVQNGGWEVVTAMSLLIGTDYNMEGLRGVGKVQAEAFIVRLLAIFQQQHLGGEGGDNGFVDFVINYLAAPADPDVLALKKCTGCKRCGHDGGLKGSRKCHGKEGCHECGTLGVGGCHPPPAGQGTLLFHLEIL